MITPDLYAVNHTIIWLKGRVNNWPYANAEILSFSDYHRYNCYNELAFILKVLLVFGHEQP